ncbi:MAG TPA: hypothetical protein VM219_08985 [Phycisphaerae bacterium]|nr:hypothetical protein [Phycisphaerae bacterium]HUX02998.1 hypothetical protein [Phycisphaerae bacterium]
MATYSETMLHKYETLLESSAGLNVVTIDGQSVSFADLEVKRKYWQREVAKESGAKPAASTIDLSRTF